MDPISSTEMHITIGYIFTLVPTVFRGIPYLNMHFYAGAWERGKISPASR